MQDGLGTGGSDSGFARRGFSRQAAGDRGDAQADPTTGEERTQGMQTFMDAGLDRIHRTAQVARDLGLGLPLQIEPDNSLASGDRQPTQGFIQKRHGLGPGWLVGQWT
jgi:hypothetical protein